MEERGLRPSEEISRHDNLRAEARSSTCYSRIEMHARTLSKSNVFLDEQIAGNQLEGKQ